MKLYTVKNLKTDEIKYFIKKNNLAKNIGINADRVELAIMKNRPIRKRSGDEYSIEYRDVNIGIKLEDEIIQDEKTVDVRAKDGSFQTTYIDK